MSLQRHAPPNGLIETALSWTRFPMTAFLLVAFLGLAAQVAQGQWIDYPSSGIATMTHYECAGRIV